MKDRFDLENEITRTHTFADQLRLLSYGLLERSSSIDEASNAIEGLAVLIDLHASQMFDTFCQSLSLDQYKETRTEERY